MRAHASFSTTERKAMVNVVRQGAAPSHTGVDRALITDSLNSAYHNLVTVRCYAECGYYCKLITLTLVPNPIP